MHGLQLCQCNPNWIRFWRSTLNLGEQATQLSKIFRRLDGHYQRQRTLNDVHIGTLVANPRLIERKCSRLAGKGNRGGKHRTEETSTVSIRRSLLLLQWKLG